MLRNVAEHQNKARDGAKTGVFSPLLSLGRSTSGDGSLGFSS